MVERAPGGGGSAPAAGDQTTPAIIPAQTYQSQMAPTDPETQPSAAGSTPTPTTPAIIPAQTYQSQMAPTDPGRTGLIGSTSGIGGTQAAGLSAQQSATQMAESWAQSVGLQGLDGWIASQINTLAGEGITGSDAATWISSNINSAPGFDELMPGYNQRIVNGYSNTDATAGAGIAGYIAYGQMIQSMAQQAGMLPGTVTQDMIGASWANDVSVSEMSTRITDEYTAAVSAPAEVKDFLTTYFGVADTDSALASYYLNPDNTVTQLQQQLNAANVGAAGVTTGFGQISKATASALGNFLGQSSSGVNQVNANQVAGQLTASIGPNTSGGSLGSAAALAQGGFENALPGQEHVANSVVTQNQLLGAAVEGNQADLNAVDRATQARTARSKGGGGATTTAEGAVGLGFAQE